MKVLTIRQPWAHLIVHGARKRDGKTIFKDIENRTWHVRYRGQLGILAGVALSKTPLPTIERAFGIELPQEMLFGKLIGVVDLVEIVGASSSIWFEGPYGWVLRNPRAITPHPMRGAQNLITIPDIA